MKLYFLFVIQPLHLIVIQSLNIFNHQMLLTPERNIVHMDLDCFFVSVSRLINPKLNGKPVLVGGGERGVVAACSYEARKFGIHSAMPMKQAKRLCPEAIVVRGDYEEYTKKSDEVTEIISQSVPVYEKASIDEFYMDLTGMDKFFKTYDYVKELWEKIKKESGLPLSFGLSANKTVSKIATDEAKPCGQLKINFGGEKIFLAPLAVNKIPGVGEKTYHLLRSMGVQKINTLQQMPVELMERALGENGISIWKKANGIDNSPVEPYDERKSISTEETFDTDTIDVQQLKFILIKMTEKLCYQLRDEVKLTSCVTVKIRYSDFDTHTMQSRIAYTSSDHTLIARVKELFDKLFQRRVLIRLVGVRFSHLVRGGYQINLFEDSESVIKLYQAMDRMRHRYGSEKLIRAAGSKLLLREFNPFNGIKKDPNTNSKTMLTISDSSPAIVKGEIPFNDYFILLTPTGTTLQEIQNFKSKLSLLIGNYPGKYSAPHITLFRFWCLNENEEKLLSVLYDFSKSKSAFTVYIEGFHCFESSRTLYADIQNKEPIEQLYTDLVTHIKQNMDGIKASYKSKLNPHLTIGKELSEPQFYLAKEEFLYRRFDSEFSCPHLTILKRPVNTIKKKEYWNKWREITFGKLR